MFGRNSEAWKPVFDDNTGDTHEKVRNEMAASQVAEIAASERSLKVDGNLKTLGFTGALIAGLGVLVAGALAPFVPAAALTYLAATAAVGNVTWPTGLGVMAFGEAKKFFNLRAWKDKMAGGTSRLFRKHNPAPVTAATQANPVLAT